MWAHRYELVGTFQQVCRCLEEIAQFPYPARLGGIEVKLLGEESSPWLLGGDPPIQLEFYWELYYHDQ